MNTKVRAFSLLSAVFVGIPAALSIFAGPGLASARSLSGSQAFAAAGRCPKVGTGSAGQTSGARASRPVFARGSARLSAPRTAKQFAQDVLAEAAIPRGSARATISRTSVLATAVASPAVKGLIDIHSAYKVALTESKLQAYEEAHLPRGARLETVGAGCNAGADSHIVMVSVPVAGSHEYSAGLTIGIVALAKRSSLLRIDAQVVWVANRPAAEKAQSSSALKLTVYRSNQFGGNITVTLAGAREREVTSSLNSLRLGAASQCAQSQPLYQLQYTSARSSFRATGYRCAGTVLVAVNRKAAAPLHDGSLSVVRLLNSFLPTGEKISGDASAGGWAGWVDVSPPSPPGQYESAFGEWTVPKASCDPFEQAAAVEWVGIDGFGESTVEQAGTESSCNLGQGTYGAWWELFGTPVNGGAWVDLPGDDHVHPGDQVSVQVVAGHGSGDRSLLFPGEGTYLFTLENFTEHWSYQTIQPAGAPLKPSLPNQTVEWIVEQPSCFWMCQALAQYGQVTFTNMTLSLNTFDYPFGPVFSPGDLSSPGPFSGSAQSLVTGSTLKETGSALSGPALDKEVVTWVHK